MFCHEAGVRESSGHDQTSSWVQLSHAAITPTFCYHFRMIRISAIAALLTGLASATAGSDQFNQDKVRSARNFEDIRTEVEALRGLEQEGAPDRRQLEAANVIAQFTGEMAIEHRRVVRWQQRTRQGQAGPRTTNLVIVVEACTDPGNPVWLPVATNTLTAGSAYFSDPQWTNYPARFYRLRSH